MILLVGLIGCFIVFPILLVVLTAFAVSRLGWKWGGVAILAFAMITSLGSLFAGVPLIAGFLIGLFWSAQRTRRA